MKEYNKIDKNYKLNNLDNQTTIDIEYIKRNDSNKSIRNKLQLLYDNYYFYQLGKLYQEQPITFKISYDVIYRENYFNLITRSDKNNTNITKNIAIINEEMSKMKKIKNNNTSLFEKINNSLFKKNKNTDKYKNNIHQNNYNELNIERLYVNDIYTYFKYGSILNYTYYSSLVIMGVLMFKLKEKNKTTIIKTAVISSFMFFILSTYIDINLKKIKKGRIYYYLKNKYKNEIELYKNYYYNI